MCGNESQAEARAWLVLILWANFRLGVLIAVMLIEKACITMCKTKQIELSNFIDIVSYYLT